jgi:hypothetical protein
MAAHKPTQSGEWLAQHRGSSQPAGDWTKLSRTASGLWSLFSSVFWKNISGTFLQFPVHLHLPSWGIDTNFSSVLLWLVRRHIHDVTIASYNRNQLFAPPGFSGVPHITASLPSRRKCMLPQMVYDSYSMSHCFIQEVRITLIRKAKTSPLVNTSLLLTLESTGSE